MSNGRTGVDIVRGFRKLRALVIGDAMLDSYLEGSASRLCAEGPVPVVRKSAEQRTPGGAANTAANLQALGAEVFFLSVVGQDTAGTLLRTALRDQGIDDRWLLTDERAETLHKLRILADGQYVVRFDEGETNNLLPRTRDQLLAWLDHLYPHCDLVIVSDYNYGVVSDQLVRRLTKLREERPCVLAVDSKNLARFRDAQATVITPNQLEARLAIEPGLSFDGRVEIEEVKRIGRRLLEAIDAEHVAITLAQDGVCLVDRRGRARHLPAHPVTEANVIGAGDSFTATLALGLAVGASCAVAARIGIEAASIAVGKQRTAVVHHQELLQRISLRDHVPYLIQDDKAQIQNLSARIEAARLAGQTVVFTNGVFDILHAGHVQFLRQAKALGDLLVVGVNTDRSAKRLKGAQRPINSERDRLALVAALDAVDHAVLFDDDTPTELIRILQPHIHAKGGDYAGENLPEAEAVHEVGGRVVILPLAGTLSTSSMIERIVAMAASSDGADL